MDEGQGFMHTTHTQWIERELEPFGPKRPLPSLIEELNRIFHASEAWDYDRRHAEIWRQLPGIWATLIETALSTLPDGPVHVLDFGCGTGFEAYQLLQIVPRDRIASLTCYDLSPEMLDQCRRKIEPIFPPARFTSQWKEVEAEPAKFGLLATNSLLHHLPDLSGLLQQVTPVLTGDAVWIAGHEPSRRYYQNHECIAALQAFQRQLRWRRYVTPKNYLNRARALVGLRSSPAEDTARKALQTGLFERRPPEELVSRLVDFHVPHSPAEAAVGRGLDFQQLAQDLKGSWRLAHVRTYSFMGPFFEDWLPRRWRAVCKSLAEQCPHDGANFSCVWRRL